MAAIDSVITITTRFVMDCFICINLRKENEGIPLLIFLFQMFAGSSGHVADEYIIAKREQGESEE